MIVKSHGALSGFAEALQNKLRESMTISELVQGLEGSPNLTGERKQTLIDRYEAFNGDFWSTVFDAVATVNPTALMVQEAKRLAQRGRKDSVEVTNILVNIFAAWSLLDTSSYRRAAQSGSQAGILEAK